MNFSKLHKRYSNYRYCIVRKCKNTSIKTPEKLWIKVPSETNIRNTWLTLVQRDPESLSNVTQIYLCADHFDLENDMENYMQYKIMGSVSRIRMKPGCVPFSATDNVCNDIEIEEHDILTDPKIRTLFPDITKLKTEISDESDGTEGVPTLFTVSCKIEPLESPASEIHEEQTENSMLSDHRHGLDQKIYSMKMINDIQLELADDEHNENTMQYVSADNQTFKPIDMQDLNFHPRIKEEPYQECSGTTANILKSDVKQHKQHRSTKTSVDDIQNEPKKKPAGRKRKGKLQEEIQDKTRKKTQIQG